MATAGVLAAALMGLWLGVPAAVRWAIETVGTREIGRALRVGDVRFNPFTLTVSINGFSIAGQPDEPPLLTIDTLEANLSAASVRHRAPVIEALRVRTVRINLVRVAANRFNFSDIVDRLLARPSGPEPARFALYNAEIDDAAIALDDRVEKSRHTLDAIRLAVPFISSLSDDVEIKVQPSFSARFDGQPITLTGETQPFDPALDTNVALKLSGVDLPRYLGYLPLRLNFDLRSGVLDTDLRIVFRRAAPASRTGPARAAQLGVAGAIALRDVALAERGATAPMLSWRRLDVVLDEVAVLDARARIRAITLAGAHASVVRRADGSIAGAATFARPVDLPPSPAEHKTETGRPFAFEVGELKINDAALDFRDDGVGFARRLAPITVELKGLSNHPDAPARLTASLAADDQTRVNIGGEVGVAPLTLALDAAITALPLKSVAPYLQAVTTARIDGSLDAGARIVVAQADGVIGVKVDDARIETTSVRVRDGAGGSAALDLSRLAIAGGAIDVAQRSVALGRIALNGLRIRATRFADGAVDWSKLIVESNQAPAAGATVNAAWKVRLAELQLNGGRIDATDQAVDPPARLTLDGINASMRDYSSTGTERTAVTLRARTGGGSAGARGWLRATPLASSLDLDIANIDVGALRPYLKQFANAVLSSGSLSTKGRLAVDAGPTAGGTMKIAYDGNARLSNLALLDGAGENELLRWQTLNLDAIKLRTSAAAPEIELGAIQLADFYARVILSAAGRLNLVDVFRSADARGEAADSTSPAPSSPAPAVSESGAPAALIRIGGIDIVRGNVNFTDNFVKPNYTANLTDLGGTVSALASDAANPADIAIRGQVDGDAPVQITGKANPLAPTLFLDIAASTKGVELPRLTPYAVKYAGYPIVKGKLSMDVRYHIDSQQLKADNHVFLDQLTFGERVESPTATKLPVLFAVSLLKNRRGEIDVNLPISGSLNDPQFSIGAILVRVIVNLLTKAVTAPFSLLASAFGGGEELGYLEFPPGKAMPTSAEARKLDTLSKALNDRPSLRLEITGRVDPAADAQPLRVAKLDAKLKSVKVRDIVRSGQSVDPATVTITETERSALIARVYADEKIPDKPRNVIGIAKTISAADMERLILSTIGVGDEDLRKLANDRAAAVRDQLEAQGGLPRDRLFLTAPKLNAADIKDKGRPTRVDFSLK